jgi:hypothetical protein
VFWGQSAEFGSIRVYKRRRKGGSMVPSDHIPSSLSMLKASAKRLTYPVQGGRIDSNRHRH